MKTWTLYIIETVDEKLYTGITTDLDRRFEEHLQEKNGAKFFRTSRPRAVVYRRAGLTRSQALKLEASIKKMTRPQKLKLIQAEIP